MCGLLLCVATALLLLLFPPVLIIPLEGGQFLDVWRFRFLLNLRLPLALLLGLLSLGTWWLGRAHQKTCPWAYRLAPLAALPWVAMALLFADRLGKPVASNVLFFGPLLVAAWTLQRGGISSSPADSSRRTAGLIFVCAAVAFAALGIFFSSQVGEHAGDEAHYLIQAESLYHDGDLAVNNQLGELPAQPEDRRAKLAYNHMLENGETGRIYSYHPWGLSLLAAPFWAGGLAARQLLLALFAAAGCAGMFLLCRRSGAGQGVSLVATLSLAASFFWVVYSIRFLPEVLGATLLVWTFWALAAQKDHPWRSLVVATACCAFLPFLHTRFIPPAWMGIGFYGLAGLLDPERWPRKILRLGLLGGFCLGALLALLALQKTLYGSGPYAVGSILFLHPIAAWAIFFDSQGLLSTLPVFVWYAAATLTWWLTDRQHRFLATALALTFVAVLLTSCTNAAALGGACVPGRYLLVVLPLLLPGTAHLLSNSSAAARGWFFFLAGISVLMLFFTLAHVSEIGRAFNLPHQRLLEHPWFIGLLNPFASLIYPRDATATRYASVFVAILLLATFWLLRWPPKRWTGALLPFGFILAAALLAHHHEAFRFNLSRAARLWDLSPAAFQRRPEASPMALFNVSKQVCRDTLNRPTLTIRDLGEVCRGNLYSQPRLAHNDWAGRPLGWLTLTAPFSPPAGHIALRLLGHQQGPVQTILALRQGSRLLYEGPAVSRSGHLDVTWLLPIEDDLGDLYVLARLEGGPGEFKLEQMHFSPCPPALLKDANLYLPNDTIIVNVP